ncbi:MAG: TrkH family potassium uptake protein [Clostridiales Family XIII bacterium]|jgi:trk system potassium uptake protein TrkH|nr:TrkH family potassium uptake protein [Clostridiales Family XIII bacterium]
MRFNFQAVVKITGVIILFVAAAMLPPLVVSLCFGETAMVRAFLWSVVPLFLAGGLLLWVTKPLSGSLRIREGIFVVALCWTLASVFGALPYAISGVIPNFADALFESASGFTTTGATLIANLAEIPNGLMFWRSLSNWIGGMGILIFAISILPALGIGALNLAKAETPGPTLDKMTTRISDNAKFLYILYSAFSGAEFLLLLGGGMNAYDAAIHTFGSVSTGGLSNYDNGLIDFENTYIALVIACFCILSSINFVLYNEILHRRWKHFFNEPETRAFFCVIAGSVVFLTVCLWASGIGDSVAACLKSAFLQASAFITTSGYVHADYAAWPAVCRFLFFMLLIMGGCSSSTTGGMKIVRVQVLFKLIKRSFHKRLHPRSVVAVKLANRPVSAENVSNITAFILMYFVLLFAGALLLSLDGKDMLTAFSAVAAMLSNAGIGFGELNCTANYMIFSRPARLFLSFLMIAGRLEFFTVLILLTPSYWRTARK